MTSAKKKINQRLEGGILNQDFSGIMTLIIELKEV
jgi:hypothetical protein